MMKVNNEDSLLGMGSNHRTIPEEYFTSNSEEVEDLLHPESDIMKIHLRMEKEVDEVIGSMLDEDNVRGFRINKNNGQYDRDERLLVRRERNDTFDATNEIGENIRGDDEYYHDGNINIDASIYSDSENSMEDEMGRLRMISDDLRQDIESQNHGSMMHLLGQLVSDDEGSVVSECSSPFMVEYGRANDVIPCIKKEENVANAVGIEVRRKANRKRRRRRIVPNKLRCASAEKGSTSISSRNVKSAKKKNRSPKKANEETRVLEEEQHQSSEIEVPDVVKNGPLKYFDPVPTVLNLLLWLIVSRFLIHSTNSLLDSEGMPTYCMVRRNGNDFMC